MHVYVWQEANQQAVMTFSPDHVPHWIERVYIYTVTHCASQLYDRSGESAVVCKAYANTAQHAHTRAETKGEVTIQSSLSLLPVQYTLSEDPYTRLPNTYLSQYASQTQAVAMAMKYEAQYANMKL